MNQKRDVQVAVLCIQELDAHPGQSLSCQEISRHQGIPLNECTRVIRHLSDAGIIEHADAERVVLRRPVEELTALEILQAVWAPENHQPAFQLLIGGRQVVRKTFEAIRGLQTHGFEDGLNG